MTWFYRLNQSICVSGKYSLLIFKTTDIQEGHKFISAMHCLVSPSLNKVFDWLIDWNSLCLVSIILCVIWKIKIEHEASIGRLTDTVQSMYFWCLGFGELKIQDIIQVGEWITACLIQSECNTLYTSSYISKPGNTICV